MATRAVAAPRPAALVRRPGPMLGLGLATGYLSVIVLLPLAAVVWESTGAGWDGVLGRGHGARRRGGAEAHARRLSAVVALVNAVMGTLIAWVLVRDRFRGQSFVNALIDLPFALPTIVAGLTLLALYGPQGPLGVDVAYSRTAIVLALLFVTLPFVIRTVQPVLLELDRDMEEAAASLGARAARASSAGSCCRTCFRRSSPGVALAFARAVGEFGAVVLISRQPAVRDRGRVRLHLRPHRERRPGRRGGRVGRAARHLVRRAARDRRPAPLRDEARRCVVEVRPPLRRARLPGRAPRGAGRPRLLARLRGRRRAGLGRGHDARRAATRSR